MATVIYVAEVNQYAPLALDSIITNSATISGGGVTEVVVTETVTADADAELTIAKCISPAVVTENGQLTYTFTIQNIGNVPINATDSVTVTDVFNPILTGLNVTFNGTVWTEGVNYTYSETTGEFATNLSQITVPAATYTQDPTTGVWVVEPGVSVLVVSGIV